MWQWHCLNGNTFRGDTNHHVFEFAQHFVRIYILFRLFVQCSSSFSVRSDERFVSIGSSTKLNTQLVAHWTRGSVDSTTDWLAGGYLCVRMCFCCTCVNYKFLIPTLHQFSNAIRCGIVVNHKHSVCLLFFGWKPLR